MTLPVYSGGKCPKNSKAARRALDRLFRKAYGLSFRTVLRNTIEDAHASTRPLL